jgi:hypothetical protein
MAPLKQRQGYIENPRLAPLEFEFFLTLWRRAIRSKLFFA